jgi:hypothetical protein
LRNSEGTDQVKIQVVGLEVLQCFVDGLLHVVRVVMSVPQLAGDLESDGNVSYYQYNGYFEASLTKISSRGTPDFFQPFPTSFSF